MSDNRQEKIIALLQRAYEFEEGPVKVSLLEEAVREADVAGDVQLQFYSRHELIRSAFATGQADKTLNALTWCLGRSEREPPGNVDWESLLWQSKHALSFVSGFPTISLQQIADLSHDVLTRYQAHGASCRGPYAFLVHHQLEFGFPEKAKTLYNVWRDAEIDEYAEPPDWELFFEVDFRVEIGEPDHALQLAMPSLKDPSLSYDTFPWMVTSSLPELLKRGDYAFLQRLHSQSYPLCNTNTRFLSHTAAHMSLLALTQNFQAALRLFQRHLPWRIDATVPDCKMTFDLHSWLMFQLIRDSGKTDLKLMLPESCPFFEESGTYLVQTLEDWFESRTLHRARAFNERNGNEFVTENLRKTFALKAYAVNHPFT